MSATAREAFLEERRHYLGGTDIAAIAGVSEWNSPLGVYLDKVAPEQVEERETLAMRRGLALERFVSDEFERARPQYVCWHPKPIVRTDWGFPAGASVDRLVAEKKKPRTPVAVLECKTAFRFGWRDWDENAGDLPDSYYTQIQWYLAVTGLPRCYGAADVGDDKLRIIPLESDERVQAKLIETGREFWCEHVEKGRPPAPIGLASDAKALGALYRETVDEPPLELDAEAELLLSDYLAWRVKEEEAKRAADEAKQKLCALMGPHEHASVGRWRLAWKTVERTTVDSKRLKAEQPEIYREYAKTSSSRTFQAPKET